MTDWHRDKLTPGGDRRPDSPQTPSAVRRRRLGGGHGTGLTARVTLRCLPFFPRPWSWRLPGGPVRARDATVPAVADPAVRRGAGPAPLAGVQRAAGRRPRRTADGRFRRPDARGHRDRDAPGHLHAHAPGARSAHHRGEPLRPLERLAGGAAALVDGVPAVLLPVAGEPRVTMDRGRDDRPGRLGPALADPLLRQRQLPALRFHGLRGVYAHREVPGPNAPGPARRSGVLLPRATWTSRSTSRACHRTRPAGSRTTGRGRRWAWRRRCPSSTRTSPRTSRRSRKASCGCASTRGTISRWRERALPTTCRVSSCGSRA